MRAEVRRTGVDAAAPGRVARLRSGDRRDAVEGGRAGRRADVEDRAAAFVEDRNDWAETRRPPGVGRRTPLHVAIQAGNLAAAKTLMAHGADLHARTVDRQTPLSLAGWVERYRDIAGLYQTTAGISRRTDQNRRQAVDKRNAARKAISELLRSGEKS